MGRIYTLQDVSIFMHRLIIVIMLVSMIYMAYNNMTIHVTLDMCKNNAQVLEKKWKACRERETSLNRVKADYERLEKDRYYVSGYMKDLWELIAFQPPIKK